MYRKLTLKSSVWHQKDISFEWEPDSRSIRGDDADIVIKLALAAKQQGEVVSHPYPTVYEIKDPLANIAEMAVVLGQYWQLPKDLVDALPKCSSDENDAAFMLGPDGKKIVIDVLN